MVPKLLCQVTSKLDAWTIERCVAMGFAPNMGRSVVGRPGCRRAAAQVMSTQSSSPGKGLRAGVAAEGFKRGEPQPAKIPNVARPGPIA